MQPIIDTHQHLWDLSRFRLPWLAGAPKIDRSYLLADYAQATAGLNVVRTIYMEVDVEPAQQLAEAEWIFELCSRPENQIAGAVVSGRPGKPGFREYVDRISANRYLKGIRQVLHGPSTPAGYALSPSFVADIVYLGEKGLSFDICLRAEDLDDGAQLAALCPHSRFILDHCGNADMQAPNLDDWRRRIEHVAKRPNVVGKISGIVASAKPDAWTAEDLAPAVRHTMEVFGPDRVMFGGDWPVCTLAATYRQWVEALTTITAELPATQRQKLWHDNAAAFYHLPPGAA